MLVSCSFQLYTPNQPAIKVELSFNQITHFPTTSGELLLTQTPRKNDIMQLCTYLKGKTTLAVDGFEQKAKKKNHHQTLMKIVSYIQIKNKYDFGICMVVEITTDWQLQVLEICGFFISLSELRFVPHIFLIFFFFC